MSDFARSPLLVACDDGWLLRGELLVPPRPQAVVIAGHAMMVDRRTLDRPRGEGLASHLARRGLAVVLPDLRGHGESGPRPSAGGDWSYDDLVERDVPALVADARDRFPGLPLHLLGHSLFGHVSLAHLGRHPETRVDGLVLLACNVAHPGWRRHPLRAAALRAGIEAIGLTTRMFGRLPVRRLRLGSDDEAPGYVEQVVALGRSLEWRARDGFDYYAAIGGLRVPTLALAGAGDRYLAAPEDARSLVAPLADVRFEVVGRESGLHRDPGHMDLVLSRDLAPVWGRVADWLLSPKNVLG
jgi:oxygen-independent coproporphyrinogen-3 oxidase